MFPPRFVRLSSPPLYVTIGMVFVCITHVTYEYSFHLGEAVWRFDDGKEAQVEISLMVMSRKRSRINVLNRVILSRYETALVYRKQRGPSIVSHHIPEPVSDPN